MPSFAFSIPDLERIGPVVEVEIAVGSAAEDALRRAGTSIPTPVRATAMIDTGASHTAIQQGLVGPLSLNPVGVIPVITPSSTNVPCQEYAIRLLLPIGLLQEGTLNEIDIQGQYIQFLICRHFLVRNVFVYIVYHDDCRLIY